MSMETLTAGIIAKLCTGIQNAECVVQIIAVRNDNGRYRVLIHDGIHMSSGAELNTEYNPQIDSGTIGPNTILRVSRYSVRETANNSNKKFFAVLNDVEVVAQTTTKIGNPVKWEPGMTFSTRKTTVVVEDRILVRDIRKQPNPISFSKARALMGEELSVQNTMKGGPPKYSDFILLMAMEESSIDPCIIVFAQASLEKVELSIQFTKITEIHTEILPVDKWIDPSLGSEKFLFHGKMNGDVLRCFLERKSTAFVAVKLTFDPSAVVVALPRMIQDRLNLLESGDHSDVIFKVNGHEINAHKCILASQSEYFQSMFRSGMEETETNQVTVVGFEPEIFRDALKFLYTGWEPAFFSLDKALALLPLADMYQLSALSQLCVARIKRNLTSDKVGECLSLVSLLNHDELKQEAFGILKKMSEKDRWGILLQCDEELIDQFVISLEHVMPTCPL